MSWREWSIVVGVVVLVPIAFYAALPWLIGPLLHVLLSTRYRLRVRGREHVPKAGPVLLVSNHVTWYDGFFLAASSPRRGGALVNGSYINLPIVRALARRIGLIPVPFTGPRAQRAMIEAARQALDSQKLLAIFPEGQLTRNGLTGPFLRGLEVILSKRDDVPVIPVYLDNLWGSMLSFSEGRFLRKRPEGFRRTVNIVYGPPVPAPITAASARQAVLEAGVRAFSLRTGPPEPLDTIDPTLPHLDHPALGPLTGSTADFASGGVVQVGQKPGTVGHPLPGVALRAVDDAGRPLPPETEGRLQALTAAHPDWTETGLRGSLDRDGFVRLADRGEQMTDDRERMTESG